ncbi:hypothetical protein L1987_74708 [Smallanthus sonchifolius]|uniref:Uncharacterized protein n=1 Tax=Smallanthus sonchifolius TaxID=185202 RepID=A0ACB9A3T4_9ASTR|nr:hypothetical protein L1987_74708 [Smallanthus sonchifolius]
MSVLPRTNPRVLHGSEKIGEGQLLGPEHIVYDPKLGLIYTSCGDGWIKRVTVDDSVVEDWVNTGGRPLGLALGYSGEVYVADAFKSLIQFKLLTLVSGALLSSYGILKITEDREIEALTDEVKGVKFGTTKAVAVAKNGFLYFTDASWKYDLHNFMFDVLEGRPYGHGNCRLRCKRYYIQGEKAGSIDVFIERLPVMPDNIRYDGTKRKPSVVAFESDCSEGIQGLSNKVIQVAFESDCSEGIQGLSNKRPSVDRKI